MNLYHVLNRGTDKRNIVMDTHDRLRFVRDLYEMNTTHPVTNLTYLLQNSNANLEDKPKRERLVDIHGWCLMGNHYHLLLSERTEGGISKFLQKFNGGYTMYFNKRHDRSGVLYQGKTKKVHVNNDAHFLFILIYIHCNPLDLMKGGSGWRTQCLANTKGAQTWIENYRWSSYKNYIGDNEFAEILEGSELFADRKNHAAELARYLRSLQDPTMTTLYLE